VSLSGGTWVKSVLHDFTGGADGYCPLGNVIVGSDGTLYGTTLYGGAAQSGVVFAIAP
jgi:uncharacterized repeat protein (TIGR03803 family)